MDTKRFQSDPSVRTRLWTSKVALISLPAGLGEHCVHTQHFGRMPPGKDKYSGAWVTQSPEYILGSQSSPE